MQDPGREVVIRLKPPELALEPKGVTCRKPVADRVRGHGEKGCASRAVFDKKQAFLGACPNAFDERRRDLENASSRRVRVYGVPDVLRAAQSRSLCAKGEGHQRGRQCGRQYSAFHSAVL